MRYVLSAKLISSPRQHRMKSHETASGLTLFERSDQMIHVSYTKTYVNTMVVESRADVRRILNCPEHNSKTNKDNFTTLCTHVNLVVYEGSIHFQYCFRYYTQGQLKLNFVHFWSIKLDQFKIIYQSVVNMSTYWSSSKVGEGDICVITKHL